MRFCSSSLVGVETSRFCVQRPHRPTCRRCLPRLSVSVHLHICSSPHCKTYYRNGSRRAGLEQDDRNKKGMLESICRNVEGNTAKVLNSKLISRWLCRRDMQGILWVGSRSGSGLRPVRGHDKMGHSTWWLRHIVRNRWANRRPAAQGDWREFLQMVLMCRVLPTIGSPSHLRSHLRQLDGQPSRI